MAQCWRPPKLLVWEWLQTGCCKKSTVFIARNSVLQDICQGSKACQGGKFCQNTRLIRSQKQGKMCNLKRGAACIVLLGGNSAPSGNSGDDVPTSQAPNLAGIMRTSCTTLGQTVQKMQHSDFSFRSVPEVQFNISTCVSESEFWACSNWAHYRYWFRI